MSTWYEVDNEDIDIDPIERAVLFYVCNDDHGGIYLSVPFDQFKEIAKKIEG